MAETTRHIQVYRIDGIHIVTFVNLQKKVYDEEIVREIGDAILRLAENGQPCHVLLDFENIQFAPFACFEAKLLRVQKRLEKDGGVMTMVNLSSSVRQHFSMNKLDRIFHISDSFENACRVFSGRNSSGTTRFENV